MGTNGTPDPFASRTWILVFMGGGETWLGHVVDDPADDAILAELADRGGFCATLDRVYSLRSAPFPVQARGDGAPSGVSLVQVMQRLAHATALPSDEALTVALDARAITLVSRLSDKARALLAGGIANADRNADRQRAKDAGISLA